MKADNSSLLSQAETIEQAEIRRKEAIESKASSLTAALAVSIALITIIPAIMGKDWGLPRPTAVATAAVLALAVIHLLVAAYYAVSSSRIAAFFMTTTGTVESWLQRDIREETSMIAEKLTNAEMNIPALLVKSNCLAVAQTLFLRGVFLFGIAASVALVSKILCD